MTVLHGDGFSLYGTAGTSQTNMAQGVFAAVQGGTCVTTNPRGNGSHSFRLTSANQFFRRVLGGDYAGGVGFALALYSTALPVAQSSLYLFQGRDGSNANQFTVTVSTTGVIEVRTGSETGTIVAQSASPVITTGAYQHVEILAVSANSGSIEIRVQGVTVVNATGIDLQGQGSSSLEQYACGASLGATFSGIVDITDIVAYNTLGAINNTFLGDIQALPWRPTADTAITDWTRNTGASDFGAISDTTPDGDTTYVEATATSQKSDFAITDVPATTSDVIAVITQPMMRKTDAGAGSVTVSMESAGSPPAEHSGATIPLTQTYTYYPQVHETDPATGVRWTPSGFNAARVRFNRAA